MSYHEPVMLQQCIEGLNIRQDGIYTDVTFGGGGHSKAILEHLGEKGRLFAFDQDEDAQVNRIADQRFTLIRDNFRNMQQHLSQQQALPLSGILADLGVSSHQFDEPGRGFSIRFDHDLDMRMDTRTGTTALEILNSGSEKELVAIFSGYGEVKNSKTLAATIVQQRNKQAFTDAASLRSAIAHLVPKAAATQYMAQVYQALRIEVNDELAALKDLLMQSAASLEKGGRLVVMSYHSLEDRLVKNFISKGNFEGDDNKDIYGNPIGLVFKSLTKKPIVPDESEISRNPRSRSARLRIAEKL
ncbi:MAG: 16S rRNA (cytosine(1402)-N(4))-methyltransferase RsmH [Bacteroidetes bacterium]|nr:16S rRNA (cytosine(1402)-N(4))-methyltransferase RsmH [Bacteroidota bacterium]